MKAHWPTFSAYAVAYNVVKSNYPWKECIRSAIELVDKFYILEGHSDDGTWEAIQDEFKDTPNIVLKRSNAEWDMEDTLVVGKKKQEAREMVKEDYCIYLDLDEIFKCRDREALVDLVLEHPDNEVFSLPYITFFGSPYKLGNFENCENFWRWKIFKNLPHIGHGAHGAARQFDENGRMYIDKSVSDGCEVINMNTLEVMPSILYMSQDYSKAGQMLCNGPLSSYMEKAYAGERISRTIDEFPILVLHYGWVNFENKAKNALNYWTKTASYKSGNVEHSRLFDDLEKNIDNKIEEWSSLPTVNVGTIDQHPAIKNRIFSQLKPKILNVSLDRYGKAGVPNWGRALEKALDDSYDVQWFAFNSYATQADAQYEYDKATAFMKWLQERKYDKDACVMFADGFWASTYTGPAKVISVVHGLWSHPEREKWEDDGIRDIRKKLFEYQIDYFGKADKMGHTLVCVSPFIHKLLKDDYGINSKLIPNAIDPNRYKINVSIGDDHKPLILHGITSVNKGSDILNEFKNHPLIRDKFDVASIDEVTSHFKCSKEVAFRVADCLFMPSRWEASSYLLLEALAAELPFVAYRSGILKVNPYGIASCGKVLDDYDINAFAEACVEVAVNKNNYKGFHEVLEKNHMLMSQWTKAIKHTIYEVL